MPTNISRYQLLFIAMLAVAACGSSDARPSFFAGEQWAKPVVCPRINALAGSSAVADVTAVTDSTFAVLLSDERRLLVFSDDYQLIDSLSFGRDGPRGVLRPASAVVTDTMVFVADDARSSLRFFTRGGEDAGTLRLTFIPRRLRLAGASLIVTPLVAGGSPAHLAFELRGRAVRPLGGAIARYEDVGINTLANMTSMAAFEDRVVVMHEMVVPFGYVMYPRGAASLTRRFAVPVTDQLRDRLGRVPKEPLTDRNVNQLAVVAFAAAAAPATQSVYYVTRADKNARGTYQKLVVRLDSLLQVADVVPIDVHPQHMAYVSSRHALVVANSDSEWFECRMP